jgi:hypothetical protein
VLWRVDDTGERFKMIKFIVRKRAGIPAINILRQYRVNRNECIIIDDERDEYKLRGINVDNYITLPLAEMPFYLKAENFLRENKDLSLGDLKNLWIAFCERENQLSHYPARGLHEKDLPSTYAS